jgi:Flp pilus assembly protein TadD
MKNKPILFYSFFLSFFFCIALSNLYCNSSTSQIQDEVYLNHNDSVKYVGIETCRSCHSSIYNSFIQTGMGQSFNIASKQKSSAKFSPHTVVFDKFSGMSYHPFFDGDTMRILEFKLDKKDTIYKRVERIYYIVGSGQHTNSHITNINGYLYQVPLTWYAQKQQWDLPPGFENGRNIRFNRAIGYECMSCHNALPDFEKNSINKFNTIPKGIDCERCHGPGEVHVKEKLAGKIIDTTKQIDYTIVNPKKLSWERQIDVCQRCHLQGNSVLKSGKDFGDFKPGMRLSDFIEIYMPKFKDRDDEFIMASHAQRLQMSKCFLSQKPTTINNQKFTCISCHNPHISVKVTGKQIFNNACSNCHDVLKSCKEKLEIRNEKENNCVGCHMPKSGTIDIPHVSVTDHWIRIPVKNKVIKSIKQFAGIYCINNKNSDYETRCKAYLAYYDKFEGEVSSLDSAKFYLPYTKGDESLFANTYYLFLKNDYQKIIESSNINNISKINDAWTCYRFGQSFQNLGQNHSAEICYRRAIILAPFNLNFKNKLGAVLIEQDQLDEGIDILNQSLKMNPKQNEVLTNLGFAYLKMKNTELALKLYDQALALDPNFEQTLLNKAGLYNFLGKTKEAKILLHQILKLNPHNEQVKIVLQKM